MVGTSATVSPADRKPAIVRRRPGMVRATGSAEGMEKGLDERFFDAQNM
jgi:hypothetical protein